MAKTNPVVSLTPARSIQSGDIVRLRFMAFDLDTGACLQSSDDLSYLQGGFGGVLPRIETALEGCCAGQTIELSLAPEEAFGQRDENRVIQQSLQSLPPEARELGGVIDQALGATLCIPYRVIAIEEDRVTLDGNHPWAGRSIRFRFDILSIRIASPAEQEAGYPLEWEAPR